MVRLIHVLPNLNLGGVQTFVKNLAVEQSKTYDVYVVTLLPIGDNSFTVSIVQELRTAGVSILSLNKHLGFSISSVFKLYKILKSLKPGILHFHLRTLVYACLFLTLNKTAAVLTINNEPHEEESNFLEIFIRRFLFKVKRLKIVLLGNSFGDSAFRLYGGYTEAVPNCVDSSFSPHVYKSRSKSDRQVIGFYGRFSKQKNIDYLIELSLALLDRDNCEISFFFAGEVKDISRSTLEKLSFLNAHKNFRVCLEAVNQETFYSSVDFLMFTSDHEGLPLTMVEGSAIGKGVISTDVGVIREYFGDVVCYLTKKLDLDVKIVEEYIQDFNSNSFIRRANQINQKFKVNSVKRSYDKIY